MTVLKLKHKHYVTKKKDLSLSESVYVLFTYSCLFSNLSVYALMHVEYTYMSIGITFFRNLLNSLYQICYFSTDPSCGTG